MTDNGSRLRWRSVRQYLNESRSMLTDVAADLTEEWPRLEPALITRPNWLPDGPVPLDRVRLEWTPEPSAPRVTGREPQSFLVRPLRDDGQRYVRYAEALGDVDPPGIFEDRPCYRLLDVTAGADEVSLRFGPATYFEGIDVSEAVAHELAAVCMASVHRGGRAHLRRTDLPLRALVGDPDDLTARAVVPALCTLTVRHDRTSGDATFLLHRRDPQRVASGGGLYQVAPAGMFQPAGSKPDPAAPQTDPDFDLWRCISRELSEELAGSAEHQGVDYAEWPFGQQLAGAREAGDCRPYYLGLGVDPLTLVVDLLTVVVFDAPCFDALFPQLTSGAATRNDEGELLTDIPFTEDSVTRYARSEPMQPAGAALLALAWRHRSALLG